MTGNKPNMLAQPSSNNHLNQELVCPHLSLEDDQKTHCSYPSSINICNHCHPKAIPLLRHQRKYCLSEAYGQCPVFNQPKGKKMPRKLRSRVNFKQSLMKLAKYALALPLLLILLGFVFGFWQRLFTPKFEPVVSETNFEPVVLGPFTSTRTKTPTPTTTATLSVTDQSTQKNTATSTPTSTRTSSPTITITFTFTCNEDISLYGMSFVRNLVLISFRFPQSLEEYLVEDAFGNQTLELALPEMILRKNGSDFEDFKTYLRDFDTTNILFIELIASPGDVIEFEFTNERTRYCSPTVTVPRPEAIGTPTTGATAPPPGGTSIPEPTSTATLGENE